MHKFFCRTKHKLISKDEIGGNRNLWRKKMPRMTKMIKDISEDTLNSLINAFLNEHSTG